MPASGPGSFSEADQRQDRLKSFGDRKVRSEYQPLGLVCGVLVPGCFAEQRGAVVFPHLFGLAQRVMGGELKQRQAFPGARDQFLRIYPGVSLQDAVQKPGLPLRPSFQEQERSGKDELGFFAMLFVLSSLRVHLFALLFCWKMELYLEMTYQVFKLLGQLR